MTYVSSQSNSPHSICSFPSQSFQHSDYSSLFFILRHAGSVIQNDPESIVKAMHFNLGLVALQACSLFGEK